MKASPWRRRARSDSHCCWAIFSTRTCSVTQTGWCSAMKSSTRPRNSSGSSPGMMMVLEAKPQDRRLALDLALPSGVLGPVDCCALALLAAIWFGVAIIGVPFLLNKVHRGPRAARPVLRKDLGCRSFNFIVKHEVGSRKVGLFLRY